jgi:outer membrane protein OmpA-like peptidoglycan-associated protein
MKKLFAIAAAGLVAFAASAAMAKYDAQDNAIDKSGRQIFDARGNCVFTKWEDASGQCGVKRELRVVYFDFNRSVVKASERAKLDQLAARLKQIRNVESVNIVGHADRIGGDSYNARLSQKRANAVKNYLASKGIKVRSASVRAAGESQSVTACNDNKKQKDLIACLAEDRRVEIELNLAK